MATAEHTFFNTQENPSNFFASIGKLFLASGESDSAIKRSITLRKDIAERVGWATGSLIPVLIFVLKMMLVFGNLNTAYKAVLVILIAGGLAFSAPTVQAFISSMLSGKGRYLKAWGFTILIEGALVGVPFVKTLSTTNDIAMLALAVLVSFGGLTVLCGINGFCMAERAIATFVKVESPRKSKKGK